MTEYYVHAPGGGTVGPVGEDLIRQGLETGAVPRDALICRVGDERWVSVESVTRRATEPEGGSVAQERSARSAVSRFRTKPRTLLLAFVAACVTSFALAGMRRQKSELLPGQTSTANARVASSADLAREMTPAARASAVRECAEEIAGGADAASCDIKRIRRLIESTPDTQERRALRVIEWTEYMKVMLAGTPDDQHQVDERAIRAEMNVLLIPLEGLLAFPRASIDTALRDPSAARGKLLSISGAKRGGIVGIVEESGSQLGSTHGTIFTTTDDERPVLVYFSTPVRNAVGVVSGAPVTFAGIFAERLRTRLPNGNTAMVLALVGRFIEPKQQPTQSDIALWNDYGLPASGFQSPSDSEQTELLPVPGTEQRTP